MTQFASQGAGFSPSSQLHHIVAIVPAAGVGKRMQAGYPKQYLPIAQQTLLEHTVYRLLAHPQITKVVIALHQDDGYFAATSLAHHPDIETVIGGQERADSVLAALAVANSEWVMVHDAARPCVTHDDITALISAAQIHTDGAILALPARDTIKRAVQGQSSAPCIETTLDRAAIWLALTPQMFQTEQLKQALTQAKAQGFNVTDDASAIELLGGKPLLVAGRADNIKVTQPEDLALAAFLLAQGQSSSR